MFILHDANMKIACIVVTKSVHEMYVTIFAVWKHKRHFTILYIDFKSNSC